MKTRLFSPSFRTALNKTSVASALVAAIIGSSVPAFAASPSELLEKGIYAEETKGDLDGALKIYEQIVTESKASRAFAAQAQYRIGQCHHKKKQYAAAQAAFEKLVADFPDQKELVAKARQYLPSELTLEPVPWIDGEVLQLDVKFVSGFKIGTLIYTADQQELDGRKVWRVGKRDYAGAHSMSYVHADMESFRPINGRWKHSLLGDVEAVYRPGQVHLKHRDKDETKNVDVEGVVYDNEQVVQLMRRLPLAVGYKTSIPCLTTLGGGVILKVKAEVTAKERVETAAGKFECFKVELNIKQTFWYSADAHRYPVKFEAGGAVVELAQIRQRRAGQSEPFVDEKLGISLKAPYGWFFGKYEPDDGDPLAVIALLDPEAIANTSLSVVNLLDLKPEEKRSVRAWAEASLVKDSKPYKDLRVRPESWKQRLVAGKPAATVMADFMDGQNAKVFYAVYIFSEPNATKFIALVPFFQLVEFEQQLNGIIDSFRLK